MSALTAALIAGEPEAWAIIEAHARRLGTMAATRGIDPEDALQDMRLKVWRAARRGTTFENANYLVQYSTSAMRSIIADAYRRRQFPSQQHTTAPIEAADWSGVTAPDAADLAGHSDWRQRFWRVLAPHLHTPRERVAIGTLAVQHANARRSEWAASTGAMKPAQVAEAWPHLFSSVTDVHNARRNALWRIRKSTNTMAKLQELQAEIG